MQSLERRVLDMVRGEVNNAVATVESSIYKTTMAAKDGSVLVCVELTIKSSNVSSGRGCGGIVFERDQSFFLRVCKWFSNDSLK